MGGPAWIFEKSTLPGVGQGDYVISKKRKNFVNYELGRIEGDLAPLVEEVRQLKLEMAMMKAGELGVRSAAPGMRTAKLALGFCSLDFKRRQAGCVHRVCASDLGVQLIRGERKTEARGYGNRKRSCSAPCK